MTWSQPNTFSNNQANTKELNLHLQQADTIKQGTGTYWTVDIHTNTTINTMHFGLTVQLTRCLASLETPQLTSMIILNSHLCLTSADISSISAHISAYPELTSLLTQLTYLLTLSWHLCLPSADISAYPQLTSLLTLSWHLWLPSADISAYPQLTSLITLSSHICLPSANISAYRQLTSLLTQLTFLETPQLTSLLIPWHPSDNP